MIKEEKILKEGLEKTSEEQDNNFGISCSAFWILIGCSSFLVKVSVCFL